MKKPTIEEWTAYINEKGYYDVKPEKTWHFFNSISWVRGKDRKPITVWRSALASCSDTTAKSRELYLIGKCHCGCGGKPTRVIDGNGYAYEKCLERVKARLQAPIGIELATGLLKDVPEKPKREIWKEIRKLKDV